MPLTREAVGSEIDLLIVGAGLSGLILAAWACQYNIRFRIVDNEEDRVKSGHADGLHARTLEIFDSFGVADRILQGAYIVKEICSWNPDPACDKHIKRTSRAKAQADGLINSIKQYSIKARSNRFYLRRRGGVEVECNTRPVRLEIDEATCSDDYAHPITVTLGKLRDGESRNTVKCKYVVECDGARSWVRQQLRINMEGERTNRHFGVMDIVPLTDFPDIRQSCVIHSKHGSVMTLPHGHSRLLRVYVQLGETKEGDLFDPESVTPQKILEKAQAVFQPYSLDFRICDWQSVYTIGQRVASRFSHKDRLFLCGDAVHTHSPTMGQGMNVSMQDAFNLGWKLGSALDGTAKREILSTYDSERRPVAVELIDLDRRMSDFYCSGPSEMWKEYDGFRDSFSRFLSGVAIACGPSLLTTDAAGANGLISKGVAAAHPAGLRSDPQLATGVRVGERIASQKIVCQSEASVPRLLDVLPGDGKWRVLVFAGDLETSFSQWHKVRELCNALEGMCKSYARLARGPHSAIKVLLIHFGGRESKALLDLHDIYHPWDDELGWDYWKTFSDDVGSLEPECGISAYEAYGVDKKKGCLVVLRPDQHVAYVGPVQDHETLARYFEGVLPPVDEPQPQPQPNKKRRLDSVLNGTMMDGVRANA